MQDTVIRVTGLIDQGKWITETVYKDERGCLYTVWTDSTGETWYRDIFKDLADSDI